MPTGDKRTAEFEAIDVDLRNPVAAGLLAWLWPGAGHLYQRRYAKGVLFMVCILSTYFFGLALGGGRVVYAAWNQTDLRWHYACQIGVGAPALPALLQAGRVGGFFGAPKPPVFDGFMAPPTAAELPQWHAQFNSRFDLGTLYTMIAGLLNILAIYDAYAGPFIAAPDNEKDKPPPDKDKRKRD